MTSIKLLKEPGYVFDLMYLFFLNYNTEYCKENFANNEEDKEHYSKILKDFAPFSDDLYVFFHGLDNKQCFLTYNYFYTYKESFISEYNVSFLQTKLSDYSEVVKNMVRFYFSGLSEDEIEASINDSKIFGYIKKSNYSDSEKRRLYEFFMEPVPYIQKLQYELMSKEVLLSAYYEKNYTKILDIYNGLTFDLLNDQLKNIHDLSFVKKEEIEFYISFCLLNKNCLNLVSSKKDVVYILGEGYISRIDYLNKQTLTYKLEDFGSALGEKSRVEILNLILERGEISCKDLEKHFNFSGSTAYHHLTLMIRCGVIKTRNQGKTILYSVNAQCFDYMIKYLKKYLKK